MNVVLYFSSSKLDIFMDQESWDNNEVQILWKSSKSNYEQLTTTINAMIMKAIE